MQVPTAIWFTSSTLGPTGLCPTTRCWPGWKLWNRSAAEEALRQLQRGRVPLKPAAQKPLTTRRLIGWIRAKLRGEEMHNRRHEAAEKKAPPVRAGLVV
jgi:hypothetical protein